MTSVTFRSSHLFVAVTAAVVLTVTSASMAQMVTGNIYGTVVDEQRLPIPGVRVTLTGVGAPITLTTPASGEFRFLTLSTGDYTVTADAFGFSTVTQPTIFVSAGQNVQIGLTLTTVPMAESIVVSGAPPLLDRRKAIVGTNVSQLELESIPTARDPWVVARSVPGVLMDRVNVGGSESGQVSYFVGKGSPPSQNAWNLDGIAFQQMAGASLVGTSTLHYDFDSLEEIQVATGGTDPSLQTPGVQLNLITKRGTNDFQGTARFFITDERWQATNIPKELSDQLAAGGANAAGNSISGIQDYGAEAGGPLIRDRLWLWGSHGRNEVGLITAGGFPDDTTLENVNLKLNAQLFKNNLATLAYYHADKLKTGLGAGLQRPLETTYHQKGPADTFKLEDSHVFSNNLFATVGGSYKDFGFTYTPESTGQMRQDSSQVFHNTYLAQYFYRPDTQAKASLSYFFRTGGLGHEVKLGGLYRRNEQKDGNVIEGNVVACDRGANWCGGQSLPAAELSRNVALSSELIQNSGYLSDTITLPSVTFNIGIRYDDQHGETVAVFVPGSAAENLVPPGTILPPALNAAAVDPGFRWTDWQPRIGVAYGLGSDQRTLLRASYSRYANQLGTASITPYGVSSGLTAQGGSAGVVYAWGDANGNGRVDSGELDTSKILRFYGFDPANPGNVSSSINGVDPDFEAVKTDEITLGVERQVLPGLDVLLLGTWRRMTDLEFSTGSLFTQSDYILSTTNYRENGIATNPLCAQVGYACGTLPDGAKYSVPVYRVKPGVTLSPGLYTRNNPDAYQQYYGVDLQIVKRFSDNWMARLSAAYNDWTQHYGENGFIDPTNIETFNDGLVAPQPPVSDKPRVYMNAKWQVNASASYTLPLGFRVAGNFFARQGYPISYFQNVTANPSTAVSYERTKSVLVAPYDRYRLGNVSNLDVGLSKSLKLSSVEVMLFVDVFNVLNRNTVLQRQSQIGLVGPNGTNSIREIQAPRNGRLGVRVRF